MSVSNDPRPLSTATIRNAFVGAGVSHSDMLQRAAMFDAWLAQTGRDVRAEFDTIDYPYLYGSDDTQHSGSDDPDGGR